MDAADGKAEVVVAADKAAADDAVAVAPKGRQSPLFKQNPFSYLLYLWVGPLLRLGNRRTLQFDDLFAIPDALTTGKVYPEFSAQFKRQVAAAEAGGAAGAVRLEAAREGTTSRFVLHSIWHAHKVRLLCALVLQLAYSGIQFAGPLMLNQIIKFLSLPPAAETHKGEVKAYIFASVMFVAPLLGALCYGMSNRLSIGTQIMIRAELTASIYRKALRLSTRARQVTETGRIVNHMSADVNQLQMFFYPFAAQLVTGPAMIITSLVLLWFQIKWATFIGLAVLLVSTPATTIFVKKITLYRRQMLQQTDKRVKLMNQLLVGIRVLKLYAWEAAQEAAVLEIRSRELGELRKAIPMRVGMQTLLFAAPTLAMVVSFAVYGTVVPSSFTAAKIFTSISLFSLMRFPLVFLPFALVQLSNALVSMRRLSNFFMLEERVDSVESMDRVGISVEDGEFFWAEPPPKKEEPTKKKTKGRKSGGSKGATPDASPAGKGAGRAASSQSTPDKANGTANGTPADGAVAVKLAGMEEDGAAEEDGAVVAAEDSQQAGGRNTKDPHWWLRDVNLQVGEGELVCVVGRVGSGKSSLVQAVLGEMEKAEGAVRVGGRVAYAGQQAWIVNATVKGNVTFGKDFDEARWGECVEACCLTSDLEILPGGADTEIGEKGINLSGGQKQRVSLARALYADADVYILDDPLSAVDVHVGRHIFERFINGAIKAKARLLVTNQLQYLPAADRVVVVDAGRVVVQGTYEECAANESFARLLREHNSSAEVAEDVPAEGAPGGKPPRAPVARGETKLIAQRAETDALAAAPGALGRPAVQEAALARGATFVAPGRGGSPGARADSPQPGGDEKEGKYGKQLARFETMLKASEQGKGGKKGGKGGDAAAPAKGALMVKEDQEEGQVTGRVYWLYICAYGVVAFFALIAFWSAEQTVRILTNWWLSRWTGAEMGSLYSGSAVDRGYYIGGYLGFAFAFTILTCIRSSMNLLSALRASRIIHRKSLAALVRAPTSYFDTTPVGRILNRFSKDTDDVDFLLSMSMTEFGNCIMQLMATLVFLAVIQPWILVGIAPLSIVYYIVQKFFRRSYIELQRLDAVSRSPIYAHFSESLSGVETIRAYRAADDFSAASDRHVDANHRAYFSTRMSNEWLSFRLDIIGATVVLLVALLSIIRRDDIAPSLAALALSEALDVTLFLKSAVTSGAMFETRFNSVERLTSYWGLPQEAPAHVPDNTPPDDWPSEGRIEYEDVWMRYRPELDPVLKGVSFVVSPGDKVGIVGRTGSGKSSLIVTLFRLVEPFKGRITLDGLDLLGLGLDDVRGRVAAIPQDPVLFSGSVRTNLDPYDRHTDAELWEALGHVALKDAVGGLPEGLSARVAEGGDNFSVGQRQLLCVARALLRQPQVLVADEATASVDSETDALIQRTIRREFKHCTVLTIAHRLNTVLDSTKVLVMEDGVVKEYDSVPRLMGRGDSTFRAMVLEAGLESPSISRSASAAALASGSDGEEGGAAAASRRPQGMNTFAKRMEGYGVK